MGISGKFTQSKFDHASSRRASCSSSLVVGSPGEPPGHPREGGVEMGANPYDLDQYGLTVDELTPVFAEYLDAFDIELETNA
jgi:hypothetical protein